MIVEPDGTISDALLRREALNHAVEISKNNEDVNASVVLRRAHAFYDFLTGNVKEKTDNG